MLIDTHVIHTVGAYQVLQQRYEILWRDGSRVELHPVRLLDKLGRSYDQMFLRAVQFGGAAWHVFDLRAIAPRVEREIPELPPFDTPGVVFYALRQTFASANDFRSIVMRHLVADAGEPRELAA